MPREDLEAIQLRRLQATIERIYYNVPFYRKSLDSPWKKFNLENSFKLHGYTPENMKVYLVTNKKQVENDSSCIYVYNEDNNTYNSVQKQYNTRSLYIYNLENNKFETLLFSDSVFDFDGNLYFFNNPCL